MRKEYDFSKGERGKFGDPRAKLRLPAFSKAALRRQRKILDVLGTFEFREDWDYKKDRRGRQA